MRRRAHGSWSCLVAIALVAAGCAPVASPSPRPRETLTAATSSPIAPATSGPSASVTPVTAPPAARASAVPPSPDDLRPDRTAITVTDDLRVRTLPEVSGASKQLEPLLTRGEALYVTDGPVEGSGFRWYEVYVPGVDLGGWVAVAGKDGERWVERRPTQCTLGASDDPFVDDLGYWLMHLACFKGEEFTGHQILAEVRDDGLRCPDEAPYWVEPAWLHDRVFCSYEFYLPEADTGVSDFISGGVFHPDLRDAAARILEAAPDPSAGVLVEVTGRLDHPDARSCRAVGDDPPSQVRITLECRSVFVITAIQPAT